MTKSVKLPLLGGQYCSSRFDNTQIDLLILILSTLLLSFVPFLFSARFLIVLLSPLRTLALPLCLKHSLIFKHVASIFAWCEKYC